MSFPELTQLKLKAFKPKLHFRLGDRVVFKKDKQKKPFVITNFIVPKWRNYKEDYQCKRISPQGKIITEIFSEKDLIKI